jgi:large conductance mechanosensitive channel
MLKEFKAFILKGNLVEIAVAFIMALAFAAVVASFVGDIVTPIIAAIFGQPDFSSLKIDIGESAISYGKFPFCKTDIALDATRCPNCTSELQPA